MRYRDTEFQEVEIIQDIPFGRAVNYAGKEETLTLDIYRPKEDGDVLPRVLLFVHGGGFRVGRDKRQGYLVTLCQMFARKGYACVSPDYRVREVDAPRDGAEDDAAADVHKAVEYLHANAGQLKLDTKRMGAIGGSAGGMTLSRLLLHGEGASGLGIRAVGLLWGAPAPDKINMAPSCNPPPVIFFHGDADQAVPFSNALSLDEILTKRGLTHTFIPLKGGAHTCMDYAEGITGALSLYMLWHLD
jgi:acetyl esterase/lipase